MSYYADCRSHRKGCRNCGSPPTGRKIYYCSDECRETFEFNHFWGTARRRAIERAKVYSLERSSREYLEWTGPSARWVRGLVGRELGILCARCEHLGGFSPEVNHIVPVNGNRPPFGCCHHMDNLEVVCHPCHLVITAEQRRAGLIGKPRAQQRLPLEAV